MGLGSRRGVTLIELLITLVIIFILASIAQPLARVAGKRVKELELRAALRMLRTAVDDFKRDWDRDGETLLGPLCRKNTLTCREVAGRSGYPKTLEVLLTVPLSGPEALIAGQTMKRYLRRLPVDPMTGRAEWGRRCHRDEPDSRVWCGEDVFDVSSLSTETAIDGSPYQVW